MSKLNFLKFEIFHRANCKGDLIVFPSEVESVLRSHENVADAHVFSIVENQVDKYGCAWTILKDKSKPTSVEELQAMCGKRVIEFVKFVDDFPVSENGKVLKIEMSRLYQLELGQNLKSNSSRKIE